MASAAAVDDIVRTIAANNIQIGSGCMRYIDAAAVVLAVSGGDIQLDKRVLRGKIKAYIEEEMFPDDGGPEYDVAELSFDLRLVRFVVTAFNGVMLTPREMDYVWRQALTSSSSSSSASKRVPGNAIAVSSAPATSTGHTGPTNEHRNESSLVLASSYADYTHADMCALVAKRDDEMRGRNEQLATVRRSRAYYRDRCSVLEEQLVQSNTY